MRAGLSTSVVLHAAVIGFGLFTLSAPRALEVADVEAFPVDIVPIEEMTQIQEGDKTAPLEETAAPLPTDRPDLVADARDVGQADIDTTKPATPETKPRPVEAASVPPPSPKPAEQPAPEEVEAVEPEPKPAPATEVAPLPEPKEALKPEPVEEAEEAPREPAKPEPEKAAEPAPPAEPEPEQSPETVAAITPDRPAIATTTLPAFAPAPQARPRPPKAQTAKAPERKDSEEPVKEAARRAKSQEKEFDADEVAALLNKEKPAGGGAKRSTQQASLGGKKTTGGAKLSQSELDALSGQLAGCWTLPAGAEGLEGLQVSVRFNVDASGKIEGKPSVEASSGNRSFDESAIRAVQKCDRRGLSLPMDKAETWSEIVVNFDPSHMLF